jgi:predicted nucleic acid-binding protein
MLILDTNVVSEVRKKTTGNPKVKAWVAAQPTGNTYISAITVMEIQRGIRQLERRGDKAQAAVLGTWLDAMVIPAFAGRILLIDHVIARLAGRLKWAGDRDFRDPMIAATALVHGATVATRNVHHFVETGVMLFDPWETGPSS